MLKFTLHQLEILRNNRRAFNANQARVAQTFGIQAVGNGLLGNALPLPKDVWGEWDKEGVEIQRQVLSVFNNLAASVSMPMPIGKLIHFFQTISDSGEVNVSIDGRSKARTDRPEFEYHGTPLPILDSSYGYGWRMVEAAATEGVSLDPAARANAQFKVAEALEDQTLNGNSKVVVDSNPLYGLRNHPSRNTRVTGEDLSACTGAEWLAEVNAVTAALYADNFFVEPTLYVNINDWKYARETDYSTLYPGKTIAQRILESGVKEVIPASRVPADEIIAVVKDRRTVQVLNGMPMSTMAMFRANATDDYEFTTMAAAALELKYDATGKMGLVHSAP